MKDLRKTKTSLIDWMSMLWERMMEVKSDQERMRKERTAVY